MSSSALSSSLRLWHQKHQALWWLVVGAMATLGVVKGLRGKCVDFKVYARATHRFWEGAELYRLTDGKMQFKYGPPVAFLMSPWTAWPAWIGAACWNVTQLVLFVWMARRLLAMQSESVGPSPKNFIPRHAATLATAALATSFFYELNYGQVDLALAAIGFFCLVCVEDKRPKMAGITLALVTIFKPPAGLLAIYPLLRRDWTTLAWSALAFTMLWLPVVLLYGAEGTLQLVQTWRESLTATTLPWARGATSQGLTTLFVVGLSNITGTPPSATTLFSSQLIAVLCFLSLVLLPSTTPTRISLLLLGVALLSPLAWRANFVFAWPAFVMVLTYPRRDGLFLAGIALAATSFVLGLIFNQWVFDEASMKVWLGLFRPYAWTYVGLSIVLAWQGFRLHFAGNNEAPTAPAGLAA